MFLNAIYEQPNSQLLPRTLINHTLKYPPHRTMNFPASRPCTQTKNPERSFNTRVTGIFKKANALVKLVNNANIAIYIERDGKQFYFETAPDLLSISKQEGIIHIKQSEIDEQNPGYGLFLPAPVPSDSGNADQFFPPLPSPPPPSSLTLFGGTKRKANTHAESQKRARKSWIV